MNDLAVKIDTIRILVDWKCNLTCSYCCNEQERFRKDIHPVLLKDIDFSQYDNVCVSGGEPLLFMDRIEKVCKLAKGKLIILYTNGIYLSEKIATRLEGFGINAINVGLHNPSTFENIIKKVSKNTSGKNMNIRFHIWDKYEYLGLPSKYPSCNFRYWAMNDCDRGNEYRVVLEGYEKTF